MSTEEFAHIYMKFWEAGSNAVDLSKELGVSASNIYYWRTKARKDGFKLPNFKKSVLRGDKFVQEYNSSLSRKETRPEFISRLGISSTTYDRYRKEAVSSGHELPRLNKKRFSDDFTKIWNEAISLNETIDYVRERTGLSYYAIRRRRLSRGLPFLKKRKRKTYKHFKDSEFINAINGVALIGGTIQNLADLINRDITFCSNKIKWLKSKGVALPSLKKRRVNQYSEEENKFRRQAS